MSCASREIVTIWNECVVTAARRDLLTSRPVRSVSRLTCAQSYFMQIMDVAALAQFLSDRIKVDGKTGTFVACHAVGARRFPAGLCLTLLTWPCRETTTSLPPRSFAH